MTQETRSRSLAKSAMWRLLGILLLAVISWATLSDGLSAVCATAIITVTFHALRFLLYYAHERWWGGVRWGLEQIPGAVVWLTGLPCSGKSTIALALATRLRSEGRQVVILDGDTLRDTQEGQKVGLCSDLGFSAADRHENLRRIRETARLLEAAGAVVLVAAITPYEQDRLAARYRLEHLLLVHVDTPASVCEHRDVKGMWAKARDGVIRGFTGLDAPFEHPASADLTVETTETVEDTAERVLLAAKDRGLL